MPRGMFQRVRPGDSGAIYAQEFNDLLDLLGPAQGHGPGGGHSLSGVEVMVKNNTGVLIPMLGVMRPGTPVITRAENLWEWHSLDYVKGETPAASSPVIIAQEPIASDKFGLCRVLGYTRLNLNITDANDTHASPTTNTNELTTGTSGPVLLLDKSSGTGTGKYGAGIILNSTAASAGSASIGAVWLMDAAVINASSVYFSGAVSDYLEIDTADIGLYLLSGQATFTPVAPVTAPHVFSLQLNIVSGTVTLYESGAMYSSFSDTGDQKTIIFSIPAYISTSAQIGVAVTNSGATQLNLLTGTSTNASFIRAVRIGDSP